MDNIMYILKNRKAKEDNILKVSDTVHKTEFDNEDLT